MKKIFLLSILIILAVISIQAQAIDSMLKVYSEQVPEEKVYVHFDKEIYIAGETIWFKAYLFSGFSPSVNSKNFYAELINENGNIVQRKVYPISQSSTQGNFDLADSLAAGNFIFRGYTTWMLNFDTSFIFQKNLFVVNKPGIAANRKTSEPKTYSIQFFPEGGNLVAGLQSVVAFKAIDQSGLPVFAKGNIVDSKGSVVTTFSAVHDGMGSFDLSPNVNEKYAAVWTDPTGRQQIIALPAIKGQGLVLKLIATTNKKVLFMINWSDNTQESWNKLNIVALIGQQKVFKAKANISESKATSGLIPVENLASGVLQVTVFSETWEPIAERIILINNGNYLFNAKINTSEINTSFRGKNAIEIQVDDTLLSNLSLAITDAATGSPTPSDNIISKMLLTGDIKGYVNNPAYYFANDADTTAKNLDLVMLTHGWRKYNWADLVSGRTPTLKYPFDNYLSLEAKVSDVKSSSPLRNDEELLIFLEGKDSSHQFLYMPKTGVDKFTLPDLIFYDTAIVYYEFMKDKKAAKEKMLHFHNNFNEGLKQIELSNRTLNGEVDTAAIERIKLLADKLLKPSAKYKRQGNVLATVTVKTFTKTPMQQLDEKYTRGLFRGADGFSFDLTSANVHFPDVFFYLAGKVPGLIISNLGGSSGFNDGAGPSLSWRGGRPALFLDEIEVKIEQVIPVQADNIAYIKVIRPPFIGAFMGGPGGAIAIYTKKGGKEKTAQGKGLNNSIVTGYSTAKEFYSPDYNNPSVSSEANKDYRTTLYWNPYISTEGSRKKVSFEFYNNDITKAYRVILEGVNEIGKLVRIEKVIEQHK